MPYMSSFLHTSQGIHQMLRLSTQVQQLNILYSIHQSWIFKSRCHCRFQESPAALNDRCWWFSCESEVVQESPWESLFKDCYFVSVRGSGIAKRFKDPSQVIIYVGYSHCVSFNQSLNLQIDDFWCLSLHNAMKDNSTK